MYPDKGSGSSQTPCISPIEKSKAYRHHYLLVKTSRMKKLGVKRTCMDTKLKKNDEEKRETRDQKD
jgi:hypothetical protein